MVKTALYNECESSWAAGEPGKGCGAWTPAVGHLRGPCNSPVRSMFRFRCPSLPYAPVGPPMAASALTHLEATLLIRHNLPSHLHNTKILVNGLSFIGDSRSEMPPSSSQLSSSFPNFTPKHTHTPGPRPTISPPPTPPPESPPSTFAPTYTDSAAQNCRSESQSPHSEHRWVSIRLTPDLGGLWDTPPSEAVQGSHHDRNLL